MELQKHFNKPCLVLRPKKMEVEGLGMVDTYAGSGRGCRVEGFDSFLQYMRNDPACVYAKGHHFAFGAAILADKAAIVFLESLVFHIIYPRRIF
jgi:hypothetical protein